MSWLTVTDGTNKIIKDIQKHDQFAFFYDTGAWVLKRRVITTTTHEYVGVDVDSADTLIDALLTAETNTIDCHYEDRVAGGGSIIHTIQTYGSWS